MSKERYIDLQLIKPIQPGTPAIKGKISLKALFKEFLKSLGVGFKDPCCDDPATCSPISQDEGNSIECRSDGLYSTSGATLLNTQYQDEGINLATSSNIDTINFTGNGVTATYVSNTITVDIPSGLGSSQRFGVSGEDSLATQNRFFDLSTNHILALSGSGTSFIVNQILGTASAIASVTVTNGSVQTQVVDSTNTHISSISLDPTGIQFGSTDGKYFFSNIPQYTDNAAAVSAGLITGGLYRTGDLLKIVH